MKPERQDIRNWLSSEQSGAEEASEKAFAEVFTALPSIQPSPDFVQQAVAAAWAEQTRYRRNRLLTRLAAGVVLVLASGVASYGIAVDAGSSIVTNTAVVSTQALV